VLIALIVLRLTTDIIHVVPGVEGHSHFGFWSVVPPLLTLILAFTTRQVLLALFAGIVAGGLVSAEFNIITAFLLPGLGSAKYAQILLIYLWCLGGLIGLWTRTGGAQAFASWAAGHIVRGPRSAKFFTYLLGIVFHQGGTISTLLAGTTARPVADKERVSHEELSYLIDSTASPVAAVIPFNIWPSYTAALIVGTAAFLPTVDAGIAFYFRTIHLNFFPIIALLITLLLAVEKLPWYGRRMKAAIERSRSTGKLDSDNARPLTSKELSIVNVAPGYRSGIEDFLAPLLTLLGLAIGGLVLFGKPAVNEAFFCSVLVAIALAVLKGMRLDDAMEAFIDGCKGVTIGAVILGLAVVLGEVSEKLGTANWIVQNFSSLLPPLILPAGLLALCMFVSFSTGTSLGTYAVVLPIVMPLASEVARMAGLANPEMFFALCFTAVVGGAVYGDKCSPISDTTILSCVATGADLMDHVYSQLPLANLAAILAGIAYTIAALFTY
jgi:Na+/H+ antiporter NhaC